MILGRSFKTVLMEEAGEGTGAGGGGEVTPQDTSPNQDWQNDSRLDENGNPVEEQPKGEEQPKPEGEKPDEPQESNEDKKGDEGSSEEESSTSIFDTPVVKQVETLLTDAGLTPADVTKEVMSNDGKLTPALMKALVEKHGESVASLVANQLGTFHKEAKSKAESRDKAVFDQVQEAFKDVTNQSGKETWNELSGWAKQNVPNSERKEINKLLAQGGIAAKYAIDDLVNRFKASSDFVQSADLVTGDNVSQDVSGLQPISQREYNTKFRELESKGHVYGQSSEFDKLDRQRMAGRNRGL